MISRELEVHILEAGDDGDYIIIFFSNNMSGKKMGDMSVVPARLQSVSTFFFCGSDRHFIDGIFIPDFVSGAWDCTSFPSEENKKQSFAA